MCDCFHMHICTYARMCMCVYNRASTIVRAWDLLLPVRFCLCVRERGASAAAFVKQWGGVGLSLPPLALAACPVWGGLCCSCAVIPGWHSL